MQQLSSLFIKKIHNANYMLCSKTKNFSKLLINNIFFILILCIASCQSQQQKSGYDIKNIDQIQVIPYKSSFNEIVRIMGSPTIIEKQWNQNIQKALYVRIINKNQPLHRKLIESAEIIEMEFDQKSILTSISRRNINFTKSQPIYNKQHISIGTQQYSIIQQIINNIGRFSKN